MEKNPICLTKDFAETVSLGIYSHTASSFSRLIPYAGAMVAGDIKPSVIGAIDAAGYTLGWSKMVRIIKDGKKARRLRNGQ